MARIAEFEIPLDDFAMSRTLTHIDGIELEIERVVAHTEESVMPYVWVLGDDFDAFDQALSEDPSVDEFERISETDEWVLYRMNWAGDIHFLAKLLLEYEGTILSATAASDRWHIRALFPTHEGVSKTYDYAKEHGMSLTLARIYEMDDERTGRFGLTEEQGEALTLATERGFFKVPREINLEELSEELGISHQSLSERLRRAQHTININTLLVGSETDESPQMKKQL
jgi:predicted DNA binding protein